ncbi:DUF429 domain-containing protein [Saccharibacillus sacchari]|uniref:DUF429 domain-containing protein n=1 Tax=Saccharibacillus sacchari TaxID=456493 RepID=UPI0004BA2F9A|nr:DUF429 domain-containing protein [Saccharibacillus sacchari]
MSVSPYSDAVYRGIGIDSCPGGWAAVVLEALPEEGRLQICQAAVYPTLSALWEDLSPNPLSDRILIDIPIGLAEGANGVQNRVADRNCDRDCRKLLPKRRKSSVFPVPARQALHAEDPSSANAQATGRKLSRQTINILPKIRETDDFLAARLNKGLPVSGFIEESHPELVFLRLNDNADEAPLYGKKEAEGQRERSGILHRAGLPNAETEKLFTLFARKQAAKDDLLDAAALAVAAYRIVSGRSPVKHVTEGERRQFDYEGRLEMNIVYV